MVVRGCTGREAEQHGCGYTSDPVVMELFCYLPSGGEYVWQLKLQTTKHNIHK